MKDSLENENKQLLIRLDNKLDLILENLPLIKKVLTDKELKDEVQRKRDKLNYSARNFLKKMNCKNNNTKFGKKPANPDSSDQSG